MARLNGDTSGQHSADRIRSPQRSASPSKELVVSSLETPEPDHSETDSISDDAQRSIRDYGYNSSASSTRHSTSDIFGRDVDEELEQMKSRASSHSSVSSVPASVLVRPRDPMKPVPAADTHEKGVGYTRADDERSFAGIDEPPRTIHTIRQREAAFRKPSSVRAMQMYTEDEADEDDYLTPPRRRTGMRSPGSSPPKRSPYYSPSASANKPKVKKEYPLVLLHCNLLPPSLPVPGAADANHQKILEEVLPPPYWKRWRRLQDKVGSGVLRDRGVLISHPQDMYDLLEERLLESLELRRSRLQNGHFLGGEEDGPTSEGESPDKGESETDGEQGEECPDCGGRVLRHGDSNRKWEIRVYAANGLMRAGAWAAAWKEMEKVDVEVGLWLPSEVRRTLERRLLEEKMAITREVSRAAQELDKEAIAEPPRPSAHEHVWPVNDAEPLQSQSHGLLSRSSAATSRPGSRPGSGHGKSEHEIALQTLIINYIRVLAGDRRNVALAVLSILVAFLSVGYRQQQSPLYSDVRPFPDEVFESAAVPGVSMTLSSGSSLSASTADTSAILSSSPLVSLPISEVIMPTAKDEVPSPSNQAGSSTELLEPEETATQSQMAGKVPPDAREVQGTS